MESDKVNMWLAINAENFHPHDLMIIKEKLESINDDRFLLLQGSSFQKPSTILIIAIFLGWERFFLDDIGLGVLKVFTCYGCFVWWLIDIFTAKNRAMEYNFRQFQKYTSFI